ncbi:carboxyl transferase domain-containing protein [Amycolatopsis nigrescens]|uniref:carboxyl transferase domain-containing protein n=1 Tax=Amycolatopsis nigrescens TaxID=381445 RepID=UPI00037C6844|nr:carboxyl transferase domain-containing protein [Amycolatopsis nigrescens]
MAERLSARKIIEAVSSGFTELTAVDPVESTADGPIGWLGYDDARRRAAERTGERESVVCGVADVGGVTAMLIAFEFGYLGGSIGGRTGDLLEAAHVRARELGVPVVSLVATGGSRMQEGMRALSQLQRIARQSALTRAAGLPQLSVLRDPATGGGWATLGAGADVTLALPGAQVGFAGSRVRPDGDPHAYTAEGQWESGLVDQLVDQADLPEALHRWLTLLTGGGGPAPEPPAALGEAELPRSGWDAVQRARAPGRPRADAYLDFYFDWRENISGDRSGGRDDGVRCGFGFRDGHAIAYAAQCGTATRPSGFRTAARLVHLADRFGIPVLTFVDTPGAANEGAAESAGAGPAIGQLFAAMGGAAVPITTLVIGEGGSGGALAFAAAGRTWVTPDSYFSVTSPEAAAAILKRDSTEVPATANQLRLRPQDLVDLGVATAIVPPAPERV